MRNDISDNIRTGQTLKYFRKRANQKYDPIIIDVTNECFRVIGKLVCKFSSVK